MTDVVMKEMLEKVKSTRDGAQATRYRQVTSKVSFTTTRIVESSESARLDAFWGPSRGFVRGADFFCRIAEDGPGKQL